MRSMPSQIEIYEDMDALSTRMVEAARAHDWDQLVDLEAAVARLRDTLKAYDDNGALSRTQIERKRSLIQHILDNDAEIRRYTEPWMEHLRQFLGNQASRKRIERAYGAGV